MKIVEIEYERLFSLGQYENERIGLKAEVDPETEIIVDCYKNLKATVLSLHEEGKLLDESKKVAEEQKLKDKPASVVPDFDPEDLMKHEWKGKRTGQGQYAEGSLLWGWDFRENFKPETIKALEQDSVLTIGEYEFALSEKIIQTKKIK
jgi:hypothetical protein